MIQINGSSKTIWDEGEKDWYGGTWGVVRRNSPATVRSSGVTITCERKDDVTNLGNGNKIGKYSWATYNFGNQECTIRNYADNVTIQNGARCYCEDYGSNNLIEIIDSLKCTVKSFGEHTTINCYVATTTSSFGNSIQSYAEAISIGSFSKTYSDGRTIFYENENNTLLGGFSAVDIGESCKGTVIIHEAHEQGKRIYGFNETSTLMIANSNFSTYQDENDALVLVGDNTITLEGAASLSTLNIEGIELPVAHGHNTLICDIERTFFDHLICDIERNITAGINFSAIDQSGNASQSGGVPQSGSSSQTENTSGTQSIRIRINEQQITDQVTFSSIIPFDILQHIEGKYFDYEYNMSIESLTKSGILYTYNCCSDVDELLYMLLNYDTDEKVSNWYDSTGETLPAENKEEGYILASEHISQLATALGLEYSYQAMDFISTVDPKVPGITYFDLIRSIFSWSAKIPTMLINVFIRGNKLYVIQRGYEDNTIDISNEKISQPVFSQELVRTFWGETPYNKTEVKTSPIGTTRFIYEGADNARVTPLKSDTRQDADGTTTINYSYDSDGMLIKTEERSPSTVTITEHRYITGSSGNKVLSEEYITVYNLSGEQIDYRSVKHSHTNYGQAAVTAGNSDSENIVSMVKNVPFDERPTPYSLGQHLKSIITETTGQKQQYRHISGLLPYDTSFPVIGDELEAITLAIEQLNRNKKHTATLSLFDYPHIIDFNDRIILDGEEYFLSSNEILTTPRISQQQNLTLVRYAP